MLGLSFSSCFHESDCIAADGIISAYQSTIPIGLTDTLRIQRTGHYIMGNLTSVISKWFSAKETRCLVLGLDGAGKTTILYRLKLGEQIRTTATMGFNVVTLKHGGLSFCVWDIGGENLMRPLWRHYYVDMQCLIFVVDSNDGGRLDEAREKLETILNIDDLRNCVLLIYANKQDLPNAIAPEEIAKRLQLDAIRSHTWHIQGTSATTGDGLLEGLDWLGSELNKRS
jgi:small GTP-binding protein